MEKLQHFINTIEPLSPEEWQQTIELFSKKEVKKGEHFVKRGQVCNEALMGKKLFFQNPFGFVNSLSNIAIFALFLFA